MGIQQLLNKTLSNVVKVDKGDDMILFETINNEKYKMYHSQNCCEYVHIEDIVGDLKDLIGHPILLAEEVRNDKNPKDNNDESWTWTFYKLSTIKGSVTIRWYGSSNGYYSESVDFERIE